MTSTNQDEEVGAGSKSPNCSGSGSPDSRRTNELFEQTLYGVIRDQMELQLPLLNDPDHFYDNKRIVDVGVNIGRSLATNIVDVARKVTEDIDLNEETKRQKAEKNLEETMHALCAQLSVSLGEINERMTRELVDQHKKTERSKVVKEFLEKLEPFDGEFRTSQMNKFETKLDAIQALIGVTKQTSYPHPQHLMANQTSGSSRSSQRTIRRRSYGDLGANPGKKQRTDAVPKASQAKDSSCRSAESCGPWICIDCNRMHFQISRELEEHNAKYHNSSAPSSDSSDVTIVNDSEAIISTDNDSTSPEQIANTQRSKFLEKLEPFDGDFRTRQMNKFETKLDAIQALIGATKQTPHSQHVMASQTSESSSSSSSQIPFRRRSSDNLGSNQAKKQRREAVTETSQEKDSSNSSNCSSGDCSSGHWICADCNRLHFQSYREREEHNAQYHNSSTSSLNSRYISIVNDSEAIISTDNDSTSPEHSANSQRSNGNLSPAIRDQSSPSEEESQSQELRYNARPSNSRKKPLTSDHVVTQEVVNHGSWFSKIRFCTICSQFVYTDNAKDNHFYCKHNHPL